MTDQYEVLLDNYNDLRARYAAIEAENAALRADAERYREIESRAERCDSWTGYWKLTTVDIPAGKPRATLSESIDAAIKAAREA